MVSSSHEALHWVFQKDPALLTRAFQSVLRVPFPEPRDFAVLNTDVTEIEPVERRVDTLMRVDTAEGTYLLVIEAQGKRDGSRWLSLCGLSTPRARRCSGSSSNRAWVIPGPRRSGGN